MDHHLPKLKTIAVTKFSAYKKSKSTEVELGLNQIKNCFHFARFHTFIKIFLNRVL